jgi:hypothetical protein
VIGADWVKSSRAPHSTRWTHAAIELFGAQVSEARRIPLRAITNGDLDVFDHLAIDVHQIGLRD